MLLDEVDRELERRGHCFVKDVVERLRSYVQGWKAYFRLAQTPRVWLALDKWPRHRLRTIQPKHWRRGPTIYRELCALGSALAVAQQVAANSRRSWRNSDKLLNSVLTLAYFDLLGVLRLSYPQLPEPSFADPHAGWCGRGTALCPSSMPIWWLSLPTPKYLQDRTK